MSIWTYSCYVKFDDNVLNNIKTNVAISQFKADIAYTCCKQLTCTVLSSTLGHFEIYLKNKETSVSVRFEIVVGMSWQNSM